MINALTVDVEDYWSILSRDWLKRPDAVPTEAVVKNTRWFLETLNCYNTKATFFILGEVAAAYPSLVREIHRGGHEIGVHGYYHRQVFKLTPKHFGREVADCKKRLEDLVGNAVVGHRAPAFSIMPDTRWALDVLIETGFEYDSSIFPIAGKRYGWPGFSPDICVVETGAGTITEVPLTTLNILGKRLPVAGGGYLRHFPYFVTRLAVRRIQKQRPVILYMHPYEIEETREKLDTSLLDAKARKHLNRSHAIQLRNRHTMKQKFMCLVKEFEFAGIASVIQNRSKRISRMQMDQGLIGSFRQTVSE